MFYFAPIDIGTMETTLCGEQSHHITKVKRKKSGETISFTNGKGDVFLGTINYENKDNKIIISQIELKERFERQIHVHLIQSYPKKQLFELIIQKTTELGINSITPVITDRTIKIPNQNDFTKISTRQDQISIEACKQAENPFLTTINPICKLDEAIDSLNEKFNLNTILILAAPANTPIKTSLTQIDFNQRPLHIAYLIGPEGGFSPEEKQQFIADQKVSLVSFGKTILRTETAAISIMSALRYEAFELIKRSSV